MTATVLAHVSEDVVSRWTAQSAWDNGYDDACNFQRLNRALKPNDLPESGLVCTDCSPGTLCLLVPVFSGVRGMDVHSASGPVEDEEQ